MKKIYGTGVGIKYDEIIDRRNPIIVQIGAHDGIVGEEYGLIELLDSLENFTLILVEPIKKYFDNLKNIYGKYGDKIIYHNFAISDKHGKEFMVDDGGMSKLSNVGTVEVDSVTFESFKEMNGINHIDLLLLDCEGYEFNILKQINFNDFNIDCVRYEYYWIPNKKECDDYLIHNGFSIDYCHYDNISNKIAYKK